MATTWNNIRFCNRIDTLDNWITSDKGLLNGELGIVLDNDTDSISIIVGNGTEDVIDILENSGDEYYDKFKFFAGDWTKPAKAYNKGLVQTGNSNSTGLVMKNGTISLSDDVWSKLNNIQDSEIDSNIIGDNIVLRSQATTVLEKTSGMYVNKVSQEKKSSEDEDNIVYNGFIGFDGAKPVVMLIDDATDEEMDYRFIVTSGSTPLPNKKQMVSKNTDSDGIIYVEPNKLTFVLQRPQNDNDEEETVVYDCNKDVSVDVSPYNITLNGDPFTYDKSTRSYNLQYSGGISEENQIRLQKVEQLYDTVEDLQNTIRVIKEGDGVVITESSDGKHTTQTISVAEINPNQSTNVGASLSKGSTFTCITGLSINKHGQIESVTYTKYTIA